MIFVMGHMQLRAGDAAYLRPIITDQTHSTRAQDGCDHYSISSDILDTDLLWINERWRDTACQADHMVSDHMVRFNIGMHRAKILNANVVIFGEENRVSKLINIGNNVPPKGSKDMIIVMGSIRMGDGEIDRLQNEMVTQMATTQAEDGCELYIFSRDVTDPNLLLISERWRDGDALAAHGKAPHMALFNKAIGGAKIEHISVKSYEAGTVRTLIGE